MREKTLEYLRSPTAPRDGNSRLTVNIDQTEGEHVLTGSLVDENGVKYDIRNGVPIFLTEPEGDTETTQSKTNVTFSDKWTRFKSYGMAPSEQRFLFEWYRKKFGLNSQDELLNFYRDFESVLEVGPGSGFNTRFIAEHSNAAVFALDISDAAFTTFENTRDLSNCDVVQADLMSAPFADDQFDFIIADGVLHHTPNTKNAVAALYRKVSPGGKFFFYVYREMGAARRFTDSHIREHFTKLGPDECYAACEPITELGRALAELDAKITLDKPIDVLGIPAGTHDVQRLFYYNFIKCFWNDAFDFETNNMVNFDWYHPHDAWQHTEDEVTDWMRELGADSFEFYDANPNGISVMVTKPN